MSYLNNDEQKTAQHLEMLWRDARDEIKMRIQQRDKFSIQLVLALSTIVAVSFSRKEFWWILILVPLVSTYFTMLILYSYKIHAILVKYIQEELEPKLSKFYRISQENEWETYYKKNAVPGIRQYFFLISMWVINASVLIYLWVNELQQFGFKTIFVVIFLIITLLYLFAMFFVTIRFH